MRRRMVVSTAERLSLCRDDVGTVHCPECETDLSEQTDVDFVDMEARSGFFRASKRFYLVACSHCGVAIGSGVAGVR